MVCLNNYTIEGAFIRFGPAPNAGYTIRLRQYWQGVPPLSDARYGIASIAIANGGTGYSANDVLIVSGGVPDVAALIKVDTVDGSGVIVTAHAYQVLDTQPRQYWSRLVIMVLALPRLSTSRGMPGADLRIGC